MNIIYKINNGLVLVLKYLCIVLAGAMAAVITLQIFMRIFFKPLLWSEEASRIMMVWLVFLGAAFLYNMPRNGHIKVDLLDQIIPVGIRKYLNVLIKLIVVAILVVTAVAGFRLAAESHHILSTALNFPYSFIYGALPISAVIMLWFTFVQFLEWLTGRKNSNLKNNEIDTELEELTI